MTPAFPPEPQHIDFFVGLTRGIRLHFGETMGTVGYLQVLLPWAAIAIAVVVARRLARRWLRGMPRPATEVAHRQDAAAISRSAVLVGLALFAVGFWLRAAGITTEPLEMQEASELYHLFQGWWWWDMALKPNTGEPHQFLLQVLIYPLKFLGNPLHIRYATAAFGAAVAPASLLALRRLGFPLALSAAAAALVATSPLHVWFSRLVLPYPLFGVFTALLVASAVAYASAEQPSRGWRRLYIAAQFLALATHLAALVFAVAVFVAVLVDRRTASRNRVLFLVDTLTAAVWFLPFVGRSLVFLLSEGGPAHLAWLRELEVFDRRDLNRETLRYFFYVGSANLGLIAANVGAALRAVLAVADYALLALGAISLTRHRRCLAIALAVPALGLLLHMIFLDPRLMNLADGGVYFAPRRLMTLYPFLPILAALGVARLGEALGARRLVVPVLVAMCLAQTIPAVGLHRRASLPAGDEAAYYLAEHLRDGDGVLVAPANWMRWIVTGYLFEPDDLRRFYQFDPGDFLEVDAERTPFAPDAPSPGMLLVMPELFASVPTLLEHARLERVWLAKITQLSAGWPEFAADHIHFKTVEDALARSFDKVEEISLRNLDLVLYQRRQRTAPPAAGYDIELADAGYAFVSGTWPPPFLPAVEGHERHFLAGGRVDLPLPGPGRWNVELDVRFENAAEEQAFGYLFGSRGSGTFEAAEDRVGGDWKTLRLQVDAVGTDDTFVWEFRPEGAARPQGSMVANWRELVDLLRGNPFQVKAARVARP